MIYNQSEQKVEECFRQQINRWQKNSMTSLNFYNAPFRIRSKLPSRRSQTFSFITRNLTFSVLIA